MYGDNAPILTAMGPCYTCGNLFGFDPDKVPSISVDGIRRPICKDCMTRGNALRVRLGKPPHPILPGAYLEGL